MFLYLIITQTFALVITAGMIQKTAGIRPNKDCFVQTNCDSAE